MASCVLQSRNRPSRVCGSRSNVRHSISCLTPPTFMHTLRLRALDRMIMNGSGGSEDSDRLCSRRYSSCACAGADGGGCLVPANPMISFWLSGCAVAAAAAAVHRTAAPIGGSRGPPQPLFSNPVPASRSAAINRTPDGRLSISCRPFVCAGVKKKIIKNPFRNLAPIQNGISLELGEIFFFFLNGT